MFSLREGKPIARIIGGTLANEILHLYQLEEEEEPCCERCSNKCAKKKCCRNCEHEDRSHIIGKEFTLASGILQPLLSLDGRTVDYIAGPSGSGKSTVAGKKVENFKKVFPDKEVFIFSRTDSKADPALVKLGATQIKINDDLVDKPIDIEKELKGGCIILFDDCNTVQNEKHKKAVENLMKDIMEVGRKMDITIVVTNHLVIPDERKFARALLNEIHTITVFPKSGSAQQIEYALEKYFGMNKKMIKENILTLPSRWVQINKTYPMFVLHEKGGFIL